MRKRFRFENESILKNKDSSYTILLTVPTTPLLLACGTEVGHFFLGAHASRTKWEDQVVQRKSRIIDEPVVIAGKRLLVHRFRAVRNRWNYFFGMKQFLTGVNDAS
jgi:hypothetical protein